MTNNKSLIEFPCQFPIKIVGKNDKAYISDIMAIARSHYPDIEESAISTQLSKQKTYISISITVHARDKITLDALYQALSNHPDSKMVL